MRITSKVFPQGLLILLPLYASFFGWSLLLVILSLIFIFITRQILIFQGIFNAKKCYNQKRHYVLNTHVYSHYVEKVRWCLDYLNVNYTEEQDVASLGILLLGRFVPTLQVPTYNISIQNSSDILRYLFGARYDLTDINDSQSIEKITKFLEPTPQNITLEKEFDAFGENARRYVYGLLLKGYDPSILYRVLGMFQSKVPSWQKRIVHVLMPLIRYSIVKRNRVNESDTQKAQNEIIQTFDKIDNILSDGREFILGGDCPTFIDFHFCSMAAILIVPDNYGGCNGMETQTRLGLNDLNSSMVERVKKYRETLTGKYVLKMYKTYRNRKAF